MLESSISSCYVYFILYIYYDIHLFNNYTFSLLLYLVTLLLRMSRLLFHNIRVHIGTTANVFIVNHVRVSSQHSKLCVCNLTLYYISYGNGNVITWMWYIHFVSGHTFVRIFGIFCLEFLNILTSLFHHKYACSIFNKNITTI